MRKLSRDQCIELIDPHKERLYSIAEIPFTDSLKLPNVTDFTTRTLANIRNDWMIRQARIQFQGIRGARFIDAPYGVTLLALEEKAIIRFKMLDDDGLPRNYPTERADEYQRCEDLPGIPPEPQRLNFGYRLNRLQTQLQDVLISNCLGKRLLYDVILDRPDEGITMMPDSGANTPPGAARPQSRVRIRGSEEQAEL